MKPPRRPAERLARGFARPGNRAAWSTRMTSIERQMEAFREARADKRTDAERAVDKAVDRVQAEIDQQRRTDAATAARMNGGAV